jgi:thiamine-phosphate pyrophosphorylase
VHLPETSFSPEVIRRKFPFDLVIGVSTHSIQHAIESAASGADYVFFGPVFDTPGKGAPAGTEALRSACEALGGFPVIALGGVNQRNLSSVFAAGSSGVAAIRSLNEAESRREICRAISAI